MGQQEIAKLPGAAGNLSDPRGSFLHKIVSLSNKY